MPPLNVLIQINISDENSKSGIPLASWMRWPQKSPRCRALPCAV
jgi:uncharacterized pyridoxal phosphate-containing UPF0001 family protein